MTLQAAPVSPAVDAKVTISFGGFSAIPVTVVAQGIAVYNGPIVNRQSQTPFVGDTLQTPAPGNVNFVANVKQVLKVIGNGVGSVGGAQSTGQALLNFIANAHPLPNAQGGWGTTSGPGTNVFAEGGTKNPSGINLVIGMNDASMSAESYNTVGLSPDAAQNGQGTVSLISVPPNLPAVSRPGGQGTNSGRCVATEREHGSRVGSRCPQSVRRAKPRAVVLLHTRTGGRSDGIDQSTRRSPHRWGAGIDWAGER